MKFKAGDRVAAVREIEPYPEGASGTVVGDDMLITFLGDLTLGYETVRAANLQQGYELGALIYEGVRDHVHTALHLALDALEQRKENEGDTDDSTD